MYCNNCGTKLREGAKFCNECGTKVVSATTTNTTYNSTSTVTTTSNVGVMPINKNKAIASLVLGILSFIFGVLFLPIPIIGLILGICQKEKCGEKTAGIILNAIALGLSVIVWIFMAILIAIGITADETDFESREDNYGNSDVIINDDYNDYDSLDDLIDFFD